MPVYWFALSQVIPRDWGRALLVFVILHLLVYPASNGYNSYMDRDTVRSAGWSTRLQPTRQLYRVTLVMDVLALLLSLLIGWYFAAGLLLYILASRAYSYRGIRLKKYPFLGWLTVTAVRERWSFSSYTWEAIRPNAASINLPVEAMIASSLLLGGFYPLTQIYQYEADRRDGVTTLSMVLGYRGQLCLHRYPVYHRFSSAGPLFPIHVAG